jgi:predicted nucleic acid-binding protein
MAHMRQHRWHSHESAEYLEEPMGLDSVFRSATQGTQASPKELADAYLASLAKTARLTLVTFDKALAGKAKGALLLA